MNFISFSFVTGMKYVSIVATNGLVLAVQWNDLLSLSFIEFSVGHTSWYRNFMSHRIYTGTFTFSQCRLTTYRQFVHWANRGQKIGGVRVVLPSCTVQMIHKAFIGESPGDYIGFREVIEIDELLEENQSRSMSGFAIMHCTDDSQGFPLRNPGRWHRI